jgi:hypothetical protein
VTGNSIDCRESRFQEFNSEGRYVEKGRCDSILISKDFLTSQYRRKTWLKDRDVIMEVHGKRNCRWSWSIALFRCVGMEDSQSFMVKISREPREGRVAYQFSTLSGPDTSLHTGRRNRAIEPPQSMWLLLRTSVCLRLVCLVWPYCEDRKRQPQKSQEKSTPEASERSKPLRSCWARSSTTLNLSGTSSLLLVVLLQAKQEVRSFVRFWPSPEQARNAKEWARQDRQHENMTW